MKIACVILNYNDAGTVEVLVQGIRDYSCIDQIVLVDNASTDDSFARLCRLRDGKISVIRAEKNGGYGAGNNLGVRYAAGQLGATHVLIANPDIAVSEKCIRGLARVFEKHPEAGVVTAVMRLPADGRAAGSVPVNAWPLHGFWGELFFMGPVSRRLFAGRLGYPTAYFHGKNAVYVDVVHGSMLMVSAKAFLAGGGYDEGLFLYQEEAVLARRMQAAGYRSVLLLRESYLHQEAVSVKREIADELRRQRIREQSVLYYMTNYLGAGPLRRAAAGIWFFGIRMEVRGFRFLEKCRQRWRCGHVGRV